ncbi:hypothetical protein K7432_004692 [Basidiobolus ranarum]|uniref:Uncharacterized protein n=1 Tax=Basidiobolus ranarum TaxID=34480 RepID=A0ABR2WXX9_9FUNG
MFLVARSSKVNPVSDRLQPREKYFSMSSSKSVLPQEFPQRTSSLGTFQLFKDKPESMHPTTLPSSFTNDSHTTGYNSLHSKSAESLSYDNSFVQKEAQNSLTKITTFSGYITATSKLSLPHKNNPLPLLKKSATTDATSFQRSLGSPRFSKFPVKAKSSSPLQSPSSSKFNSNSIGFNTSTRHETEYSGLEDSVSSTSSGSFESTTNDPYSFRRRCDSSSSSINFDQNALGSTPPRMVRIWRPEFTPPASPATPSSVLPFFRGKESVRTIGSIRVKDKVIGDLLVALVSPLLLSKLKVEIVDTDLDNEELDTELSPVEEFLDDDCSESIIKEDSKLTELDTSTEETPSKIPSPESPTSSPQSPLHMEWPSDLEDSSSEVILEARTGKAMVRASSLRYLVRMLACEGQNDPNFMVDFLRTYRYFADPLDVARLLIIRYLNSTISIENRAKNKMNNKIGFKKSAKQDEWDNIIQLRVLNTFKKWVDLFCEDFSLSREITELVLLFLEEIVICDEKRTKFADSVYEKMGERDIIPIGWLLLPNSGVKDCSQSLYHRFVQTEDGSDSISKISWGMSTVTLTPLIASSPFPTPYKIDLSKARGPIERLSIADIDPKDLAQQLTLLEQRLFFAIHLNEFFNHSWCDRAIKDRMTPNLSGFIRWFNKIAYGISGLIVTTNSSSARVTIVKRLIQAAQICLKIHNYNGCFEIVAGLEQSSVQRLKGLWKALPNKYLQIYAHLTKVISRSDNHRTYRTCLQVAGVSVPVLPYLGFHLTDLVFAEDGNPTYISAVPTGSPSSSTTNQTASQPAKYGDAENYSKKKPMLKCLSFNSPQVVKAQSKPISLINFAKFRLISKMLGEIVQYQKLPYEFTEIPRIHEFIKNGMTTYSEDELYLYSLQCEPKS